MGFRKQWTRSKKGPGGLVDAQSNSDLPSEQSSGHQPQQATPSPPPTSRKSRSLKWRSRSPSPLSSPVIESHSNTTDRSRSSQPQPDSEPIPTQTHMPSVDHEFHSSSSVQGASLTSPSSPTTQVSNPHSEPIANENTAPLSPCAQSTCQDQTLAKPVHTDVLSGKKKPTPGPEIDVVWDKALKIARERIGNSNFLLSLTNPTSQSDTLQEDEKKKRWTFTWRGEKVIIVDHLRRLLKAVEPYSTVVGTSVQGNPQLAAVVWAGVLAIMRVTLNHVEMIDGFEVAISVLIEKVTICEYYAGVYVGVPLPLHSMLDSALPELYASVIVFVDKARSYFEGGVMKKITCTLESFKTRFQPLIDEINTKEEVISKCAGAANMQRIREIKGDLQDITYQLKDISINILDITKRMNNSIEDQLLTMLSPLEPRKRHQDVRLPRTKHAGTWLLNLESFCEWRDSDSLEESGYVFCCYGIPGAGKTVICSVVIDNLYFLEAEKHIGVACLYADYKDQHTQTLDHILGCILAQFLTTTEQPIPDEIVKKLEFIQRQRKKVVTEDILDLFKIQLPRFDRAFICIDAVDELEPQVRQQLLNALKGLATNNTRLFLTGREHVKIEVQQHLQVGQRYETIISASEQDIQEFVEQQITNDQYPDAMDEVLKRDILNTIIQNSQGMFLLPTLHIKTLLGMLTKSKRRKALATLPTNLYDSFRDIITRIRECSNACQAELGLRVLMWLHFAYRPLGLGELQHALAVEKSHKEFDADNIPPWKALLDSCLGLVVVDDETMTVRFVHFTLEEYFHNNSKAEFPNGCIPIAETCLTYINFGELKQHCMTLESLKESMHKYVFLEYAALNWGRYVKQQCSEGLMELVQMVMAHETERPSRALQVFYLERYRHYWWQKQTMQKYIAQKFSGIHVMAYFGFRQNIAYCCKVKQHMEQKDDSGRTPLSWAAEYGHESIVQILIERVDVNINSTDEIGRTPLSYAAEDGHEAVVRLLIERNDIDIDIKDEDGWTPLTHAACYAHEAVVRLLIERNDVDINVKDRNGQTPLMRAANCGCGAVVQLLVERNDVDINVKDRNGQTPLTRAANCGYEAVVRLLIERNDVDINVKDIDGWTPLMCAAWAGHEAVVRVLLERKDVDINAQNNGGQTSVRGNYLGQRVTTGNRHFVQNVGRKEEKTCLVGWLILVTYRI